MHPVDFSRIDLNLLKLLDALIKERSVTRAGQKLHLSQPAASRALARLRRLFDDRLFLRSSHGLELTPRAILLIDPVAKLLEDARSIVVPELFDPATATGLFTIAAIDHLTLLIIPTLLSRLAKIAPGVDVEIPPSSGDNIDIITQGGADLGIGVYHSLPARFHRRSLYDENLVCVVRRGHPVIAKGLTLKRFIALTHISVIITGQGENSVDTALTLRGLKRRVAVRLPHFLAATMLAAESDMILCLPKRLAFRLISSVDIEVLALPFDTDLFAPSIVWHERHQDNPSHKWLRQQIVEICSDLSPKNH